MFIYLACEEGNIDQPEKLSNSEDALFLWSSLSDLKKLASDNKQLEEEAGMVINAIDKGWLKILSCI